jgi:hypothetical protein
MVPHYVLTLYEYQFHSSIFLLHFYIGHSCGQRDWTFSAEQSKQEK